MPHYVYCVFQLAALQWVQNNIAAFGGIQFRHNFKFKLNGVTKKNKKHPTVKNFIIEIIK